ncbi:MAG TPA: site-specific integrase [Gammaproteobacteria bacterium]|nr:site-specific integrase [Gammaproteobacteria bacterium]
MREKLTERLVKAIAPKQNPYEILDTEVGGFLLRVQPSGILTYYLVYRTTDGTKKRYRLGRHGAITVTQARDLAKQFSAKAISGSDVQAEKKKERLEKEKRKARTLEGFIKHHYAAWVKSERKTGEETLQRLNANFSMLMDMPLEDIAPWILEKWRSEQRSRGKAASTMNRDIVALKAVLSKAVAWNWLEINPLSKLKPLKIDDKAKVRYLDTDEERSLRIALKERDQQLILKDITDPKLQSDLEKKVFYDYLTPMVFLAMHTGLRRGEIFSLSWDNVDLKKGLVTVIGDRAKSGKTRHVPLNSEVLDVLKAWHSQCLINSLVFPGKGMKQMKSVRKSWATLLKKANITKFRWHDLRHHFASKLVMAGVDLNTTRELLGHSDLKVTLRYAHLAPEHKAEAVARLVSFNIPNNKTAENMAVAIIT